MKYCLFFLLLGLMPLPAQDTPEKPSTAEKKMEALQLKWEEGRLFDLSFNPAQNIGVKELDRVKSGTPVRKGDRLITVDTEALDSALVDAGHDVEGRSIDLENARFAMEQNKAATKRRLEQSETNLARLAEDLEDYLKKLLPNQIKNSERTLKRAEFNVDYKKENLVQLEKMYKEDQITEESEEIILYRTRNELVDAELALEGAKLAHETNEKRKFPRERQDKLRAYEEARIAHNELEKKSEIELNSKDLAVRIAEKKLADSEKKQAKLKDELAKTAFECPAEGILLWCEPRKSSSINAAFAILTPEFTLNAERAGSDDLKAGDKVDESKVDTGSSLFFLPEGKVVSVEGNRITITFEDKVRK